MKLTKIIKYFLEEIFNRSYLLLSLLLKIAFFLLLYYSKEASLNYLKCFTLISVVLFIANLVSNRISKQKLFFISYRHKLLLSDLIINGIFLLVNTIIYFMIFNLKLAFYNQALDFIQIVDYLIYSSSIFFLFLNIYLIAESKSIIILIPLLALTIILNGPFSKYNYLILQLEFNGNIYLNNSAFAIIISPLINFLIWFILSSKKKYK